MTYTPPLGSAVNVSWAGVAPYSAPAGTSVDVTWQEATPAGDAKYADVSLLLHGDGLDGGTTITDSSPSPKTPATVDNVTTSTLAGMAEGAVLRFAGVSTSRLVYAHNSAFQPSGDFCIEARCRVPTVSGSPRVLFWKGTSSGVRPYSLYIESDGTIRGQSTDAGGSIAVDIRSSDKVVASTWVDVCYERTGNVFRIYLGGAVVASQTYSGALYSNTSDPLVIGNVSNGLYPLSGDGVAYLCEVRITMASRYGGAYTPSTTRLPDTAASGGGSTGAVTMAAVESGSDTAVASIKALARGSLAVVEPAKDAASFVVKARAQGSLAAVETGADVFASTVRGIARISMAVAESGPDAGSFVVRARAASVLASTETGVDTFAAQLRSLATSALHAVETATDTASASIKTVAAGSLHAVESGADSFYGLASAETLPERFAILVVQESGSDEFAGSASAPQSTLALAVVEEGSDTFASLVTLPHSSITMETVEPSSDSAAMVVKALASSTLAVAEEGSDGMAAQIRARASVAMAVVEEGADSVAGVVAAIARVSLAAVESGSDIFRGFQTPPTRDPQRVLVVAAEDRTIVVRAETRVIVVPDEVRVISPVPETRTIFV